MKRILALILMFSFIFALSACRGKPNIEQPSGAEQSGAQLENDTSKIEPTKAYENLKKIFPDKTLQNLSGDSSDPTRHFVRIEDSGIKVRYATIKGLKSGDAVNIMQVSDLHLSSINDRDRAENNPVVASELEANHHTLNEAFLPNAKNTLSLHKYFDATAITGDNYHFITHGSLELLKKNVFDVIPNVLVALGNHDINRYVSGKVKDTSTIESRYEIIKEYWYHDTDYTSKIIKDRVMIIQLDNSQNRYYGEQAKKLAADIKKAREESLAVLIFQHFPIATGNKEQVMIKPIVGTSAHSENFYKSYIGGSKFASDQVTDEVYRLITTNADVVKGVFCGHMHTDYYMEILGSYQKNGETVQQTIPQYILSSNQYDAGCLFAITVE